MAALVITASLASYRVGRSQGEIEIERLTADLAVEKDRNRLTTERLAEVEQQAESAVARNAQLLRLQRSQAPSLELRRLSELAAERLRAGVPVGRLEFVIAQLSGEPLCGREIESRRVAVHVPASAAPTASAAFFGSRVVVTGEGSAARGPDGTLRTVFDPAQPVVLRFLRLDGEVATASGALPLAHALAVDGQELRFMARLSERNPAELEITAQRCAPR